MQDGGINAVKEHVVVHADGHGECISVRVKGSACIKHQRERRRLAVPRLRQGHVEHRSRGEHLDLHADLHRFVQPIVDGERDGVVSCAQARVKQQPVHAFGRQAAVKVAGPDHVEVLRATGRLTGQTPPRHVRGEGAA